MNKIRTMVAAFCVVGLAACSGSDDEEPTDVSTPVDGTVGETPSTDAGTDVEPAISIQNQPGEGEFEGALADVSDMQCAKDGENWKATGTVTNSTDAAASYRIYVSFLDPAGETIGLIESGLDALPAGESGEYAADLASAAEGVQCVLRVERRTAE